MTDFEKKVAEALKTNTILAHRLGDPVAIGVRILDAYEKIAPCVAAAIHAAAPDQQGTPGFAAHVSVHWREQKIARALIALRFMQAPVTVGTS